MLKFGKVLQYSDIEVKQFIFYRLTVQNQSPLLKNLKRPTIFLIQLCVVFLIYYCRKNFKCVFIKIGYKIHILFEYAYITLST